MTTANHYDFSNRAALVFGGTSGIGRATALRFARAGAMVAVAARAEEVGRRTCDELARDGAQSLFVEDPKSGTKPRSQPPWRARSKDSAGSSSR